MARVTFGNTSNVFYRLYLVTANTSCRFANIALTITSVAAISMYRYLPRRGKSRRPATEELSDRLDTGFFLLLHAVALMAPPGARGHAIHLLRIRALPKDPISHVALPHHDQPIPGEAAIVR